MSDTQVADPRPRICNTLPPADSVQDLPHFYLGNTSAQVALQPQASVALLPTLLASQLNMLKSTILAVLGALLLVSAPLTAGQGATANANAQGKLLHAMRQIDSWKRLLSTCAC